MKRKYHPRELVSLVCTECKQRFGGTCQTAWYCSNACKQEAYRRRKRQRKAVAGDQVEDVAGDQKENTRHEASS